MTGDDAVLAAGLAWAGEPCAIATVVSTWGSAPRPRGSHMIVHADGRFEGSVSGGCVEADILATAAAVIASGRAELKRYGVADDAAWQAGLPCGGEIAVLVQPVGDRGFPADLFAAIADARQAGRPFDVATSLDSGVSQPGTEGAFVNRYRPPHRLFVIGAVQIAQALVGIAGALGVDTTVIDPRGRFLTDDRFPGVALDDRWPDEALAALRPDAASAVVTLSHDPKIDDPALIAALGFDTGYVAALGSRKSHAARLERLAAAGLDAGQLARIDGPAGLDIGAIGPAEIALSVAAGMVSAWRGKA